MAEPKIVNPWAKAPDGYTGPRVGGHVHLGAIFRAAGLDPADPAEPTAEQAERFRETLRAS